MTAGFGDASAVRETASAAYGASGVTAADTVPSVPGTGPGGWGGGACPETVAVPQGGAASLAAPAPPEGLSALDVAAYILRKEGAAMSTVRLQMLLYYCQAWSIVWSDRPLFREKVRAWVNGPVVMEVYRFCEGAFTVSDVPAGRPEILSEDDRDTVDRVLGHYGEKPTRDLVYMAQMENPWRTARANLPGESLDAPEITGESIARYYGGL